MTRCNQSIYLPVPHAFYETGIGNLDHTLLVVGNAPAVIGDFQPCHTFHVETLVPGMILVLHVPDEGLPAVCALFVGICMVEKVGGGNSDLSPMNGAIVEQ
jgi:hypothetical protein